jgi:phenylacetate-CoA ligase
MMPGKTSPIDLQSTAANSLARFIELNLEQKLNRDTHTSPEEIALPLFQEVAQSVPAYRQFLADHGIHPADIRTMEQFQTLPLLNKENYINRFPLPMLCHNGQLSACNMVAVSSGSTGQPTFWPRRLEDELKIAERFEQVFKFSFQADRKNTLAVVCFALGTWVGGIYTANCCRYLAHKGYPVTVVTPGNNKDEIFRTVKDLGPHFEQVVLLGYPPFLKDVIDSGRAQGMDWSAFNIKLVMAGEVFSEEWRTLMGERIRSDNPCFDSASLYGTADAGVLGNETPLSIRIRRFLAENPEVARRLFGESRLPTLVQYDPASRFFEVQDGTLLFSGNNGIPLIRYHIADQGGVIGYEEMLRFLAEAGFNPVDDLVQSDGTCASVHPLPFVYVFGRSHFIVSYFGANIYPENIAVGLEQPHIKEWVTGKFVLQSKEDTDRNRYLSITVELAPQVTGDEHLVLQTAQSILNQLKRLNSEFAHYVPAEFQMPQVILLPFGDPEYFPIGVKHRYTRA